VATLSRQLRRCYACQKRARCQLSELLVHKRLQHSPFAEWAEAWFCSPCTQSLEQFFHVQIDEVAEARRAVVA
jgi:hypothetical protein